MDTFFDGSIVRMVNFNFLKNKINGNHKIWLFVTGLFLFLFSSILEFHSVKNNFENQTHFWQKEISTSLLDQDWVFSAKYVKSMMNPSIEAAELSVDNRVIFSTKSNFDSSKCLLTWTLPIKQYNLTLGTIRSCPNFKVIALNTLVSPFFIIVFLSSLMLIALSSSFTLLKYKKGVLDIIDILSKAHDDKDGSILKVNKDQMSAGDAIVNKTITLMQSLFEERLNRESSENRAKAAQKMSMLAATFAHDIRSPLSALKIATQTDLSKPGVKELIELSSNRINAISEQLLKNAKDNIQEDVDMVISRDLNNLNLKTDIIDPVIQEKKMELRSKPGISLMVKSNLEADDLIHGDKAQLQRMLSNLINNSVEAFGSQAGSIVLDLSIANHHVELLVCDNGPGIPKEVLNKIGTFGYSHGKKGSSSGNGIGVYFAKKIVSECNGTFEITSEPQHGTIIKIRFPIVAVNILKPYFGNKIESQV